MQRLGLDKPLMQLSSTSDDHNLADAKGHWVYWMLRDLVGPDLFAGVLRQLQRDFAGRRMSLADLRRAFQAAAPVEADLSTFFSEWLDRSGAPTIGMRWRHGGTETKPTALVTLTQRGDIYHLPISLEIETARDTVTHLVRLSVLNTSLHSL